MSQEEPGRGNSPGGKLASMHTTISGAPTTAPLFSSPSATTLFADHNIMARQAIALLCLCLLGAASAGECGAAVWHSKARHWALAAARGLARGQGQWGELWPSPTHALLPMGPPIAPLTPHPPGTLGGRGESQPGRQGCQRGLPPPLPPLLRHQPPRRQHSTPPPKPARPTKPQLRTPTNPNSHPSPTQRGNCSREARLRPTPRGLPPPRAVVRPLRSPSPTPSLAAAQPPPKPWPAPSSTTRRPPQVREAGWVCVVGVVGKRWSGCGTSVGCPVVSDTNLGRLLMLMPDCPPLCPPLSPLQAASPRPSPRAPALLRHR